MNREDLVRHLNSLSEDKKEAYWLNQQFQCSLKGSDRDGQIECSWTYFNKNNIWMCKVYDFDQMKEGSGLVRTRVFYEERQDVLKINKQWNVR